MKERPIAEVMLVKLGGSLITDKQTPETLRADVLARLAGELAAGWPRARQRGVAVVLGHGSGSFGHVAAAESGIAEGLERAEQIHGVARTQHAAAELHRHVVAALIEAGLPPFTIAPSSALTFRGGEPESFTGHLLAWTVQVGLLPVLYGDVVRDLHAGVAICSTEDALRTAARALEGFGVPVRRALWLGETAGVYDDEGDVIADLTPFARFAAGPAAGTDVTGGMRHRVTVCRQLAADGVTSTIADGTVPGLLARALDGEDVPGTRVRPPRSA